MLLQKMRQRTKLDLNPLTTALFISFSNEDSSLYNFSVIAELYATLQHLLKKPAEHADSIRLLQEKLCALIAKVPANQLSSFYSELKPLASGEDGRALMATYFITQMPTSENLISKLIVTLEENEESLALLSILGSYFENIEKRVRPFPMEGGGAAAAAAAGAGSVISELPPLDPAVLTSIANAICIKITAALKNKKKNDILPSLLFEYVMILRNLHPLLEDEGIRNRIRDAVSKVFQLEGFFLASYRSFDRTEGGPRYIVEALHRSEEDLDFVYQSLNGEELQTLINQFTSSLCAKTAELPYEVKVVTFSFLLTKLYLAHGQNSNGKLERLLCSLAYDVNWKYDDWLAIAIQTETDEYGNIVPVQMLTPNMLVALIDTAFENWEDMDIVVIRYLCSLINFFANEDRIDVVLGICIEDVSKDADSYAHALLESYERGYTCALSALGILKQNKSCDDEILLLECESILAFLIKIKSNIEAHHRLVAERKEREFPTIRYANLLQKVYLTMISSAGIVFSNPSLTCPKSRTLLDHVFSLFSILDENRLYFYFQRAHSSLAEYRTNIGLFTKVILHHLPVYALTESGEFVSTLNERQQRAWVDLYTLYLRYRSEDDEIPKRVTSSAIVKEMIKEKLNFRLDHPEREQELPEFLFERASELYMLKDLLSIEDIAAALEKLHPYCVTLCKGGKITRECKKTTELIGQIQDFLHTNGCPKAVDLESMYYPIFEAVQSTLDLPGTHPASFRRRRVGSESVTTLSSGAVPAVEGGGAAAAAAAATSTAAARVRDSRSSDYRTNDLEAVLAAAAAAALQELVEGAQGRSSELGAAGGAGAVSPKKEAGGGGGGTKGKSKKR